MTTTVTAPSVLANTTSQHNKSNRTAKSIIEKMIYPKNTINHHSTELHNSFGVSGNVGIGFHFGGGYRIKNGDGKNEQDIVHNKMYDKYMGTSFGFGSLGKIKKGHVNNIEQSISEEQQTIQHDEILADDNTSSESTAIITETPKPGVFKKISKYWAGEHTEPKSEYTSNGIFKWSMQKFKNKNNVGTPR